MLKKSNHVMTAPSPVKVYRKDRFSRSALPSEKSVERLSPADLRPYVDSKDASDAESAMVTRLILMLLLMGITPILLLLLALLFNPDLLHIEITP